MNSAFVTSEAEVGGGKTGSDLAMFSDDNNSSIEIDFLACGSKIDEVGMTIPLGTSEVEIAFAGITGKSGIVGPSSTRS